MAIGIKYTWCKDRVHLVKSKDPVKYTLKDPCTSSFRDLYGVGYKLVEVRTQRSLHR